MGNQQSLGFTQLLEFGLQNSMLTTGANTQKLGTAYFEKLRKRSLMEYPWLEHVKESMLITDATLLDCPIVFANDLFEKMTLYPKESILGRNCRFLQGRFTDAAMVKKIRDAVSNGNELEVEILNYRRDGTPFLNNFLMLPIHKNPKSRSGKVTHFIAIQKDISLLASDESPMSQWDATKLAITVHQRGFEQVAKLLIENNIDGRMFLALNRRQLIALGLLNRGLRRRLLQWIKELNKDQYAALAFLRNKRGEAQYESPPGLCSTNPNLQEPRQLDYWETNSSKRTSLMDHRTAFKCYWYQSESRQSIDVFTLPRDSNFELLMARLADFYGVSVNARYKNKLGELVMLSDEDGYQEYICQHTVHQTVVLLVSPKEEDSDADSGLEEMQFLPYVEEASSPTNFAAAKITRKTERERRAERKRSKEQQKRRGSNKTKYRKDKRKASAPCFRKQSNNSDSLELTEIDAQLSVDLKKLLLKKPFTLTKSILHVCLQNDVEHDTIVESLVRVLSSSGQGPVVALSTALFQEEFERLSSVETLFRTDCPATVVMNKYLSVLCRAKLAEVLRPTFQKISSYPLGLEVDANRDPDANVEENVQIVLALTQQIFRNILDNFFPYLPRSLLEIFSAMDTMTCSVTSQDVSYQILGSFLFLRFICPAIVNPLKYGVVENMKHNTVRTCVLISKLIQNLVNGVDVDGSKESYMTSFAPFYSKENKELLYDAYKQILETRSEAKMAPLSPPAMDTAEVQNHTVIVKDYIVQHINVLWNEAALSDPNVVHGYMPFVRAGFESMHRRQSAPILGLDDF